MKIASPKLFFFSLTSLILTGLIASQFHQIVATTVTRDFNFGEPVTYGLLLIQGCVSLGGIVAALKSSVPDKG